MRLLISGGRKTFSQSSRRNRDESHLVKYKNDTEGETKTWHLERLLINENVFLLRFLHKQNTNCKRGNFCFGKYELAHPTSIVIALGVNMFRARHIPETKNESH
jgi:hypothetical protein